MFSNLLRSRILRDNVCCSSSSLRLFLEPTWTNRPFQDASGSNLIVYQPTCLEVLIWKINLIEKIDLKSRTATVLLIRKSRTKIENLLKPIRSLEPFAAWKKCISESFHGISDPSKNWVQHIWTNLQRKSITHRAFRKSLPKKLTRHETRSQLRGHPTWRSRRSTGG